MSNPVIKIKQTCKTGTNDQVNLFVFIGEGQKGRYVVLVNDKEIGRDTEAKSIPLGSGANLAGKEVVVLATVNDTNPQTNRTSVTYEFRCGEDKTSFTSTFEIESGGDSVVDYEATFLFEIKK